MGGKLYTTLSSKKKLQVRERRYYLFFRREPVADEDEVTPPVLIAWTGHETYIVVVEERPGAHQWPQQVHRHDSNQHWRESDPSEEDVEPEVDPVVVVRYLDHGQVD